MDKLWVVATVMHIGNTNFFGDILLITDNKTEAKTLAYRVKDKRPVHGLDYSTLTNHTDCIYFEREVGKIQTPTKGTNVRQS